MYHWISLTASSVEVTEGAASVSPAATSTGHGIDVVAEEVMQSVADNVAEVQEQTNVFLKYLSDNVPNLISFGINVLISILIFLVGKKLIKLIRGVIRRSLERADADVGVTQFLDTVVKGLLYFILIVIIVGRFGIEASSLMAIVGSAGLAVGLALQGSLSNFAGGVLILVLKPFKVGDYIIASAEGTVAEIQIFYTKLITVDNKTIYIPNGQLSNENIVNVTSQEFRRVDLTVGISYNADLLRAKEILGKLVQEQELVLKDRGADIFVDELAASEVTLGVRVWVRSENYWNVKWDLTEKIKLLFDENGIEIPYNQMDVHLIP